MILLILIYVIQILCVLYIAIRDITQPVRALAWVFVGLFLPVIGFFVFAYLSSPLRHRAPTPDSPTLQGRTSNPSSFLPQERIRHLVTTISGRQPVTSEIQLYPDGRQFYRALWDALANATNQIDMEFYIIREDHIGSRIVDILEERARAGVRVRLLRDGMGSLHLSKDVIGRLQCAGVETKIFHPVRFPFLSPTLNHRDHCKIVTVDGTYGFLGGMNIGDEYTGRDPKVGPWRDTHAQVKSHSVIHELAKIFSRHWDMAVEDKVKLANSQKMHHANRVPKTYFQPAGLMGEWGTELTSGTNPPEPWLAVDTQLVESAPDRLDQSARDVFFAGITQASKSVDITTPYFVPDSDILTALKTAVKFGVQVRLLVPEQPDHRVVGMASRTYFDELLDCGVELHLYRGAVLHAKVMTIDEDVAVLGAANYDLRSFRLNYELCQVIYSSQLVRMLKQQYEDDLSHSILCSRMWLQKRTLMQRTTERFARLFSPLL